MQRIRSIIVLSSIVLFHSFAICSVIVLLAHPAQVVRVVVAGVAVDVVHGVAVLRVRVSAPRLSHETADKEMVRLTVPAKAHPVIALIVRERRQEPRWRAFQALDASQVADKILAAVALYGPPFFVR